MAGCQAGRSCCQRMSWPRSGLGRLGLRGPGNGVLEFRLIRSHAEDDGIEVGISGLKHVATFCGGYKRSNGDVRREISPKAAIWKTVQHASRHRL